MNKIILQQGNCPFCDSARGQSTGWGLSPEGWASMRETHDAGHTLSQSKKEEDVRDFVGQFVRHKCGKECTGCSADVDAIIERVRAADRDALVRAVEWMKHKKWNEAVKLTRVEAAHNQALDDVLALLHSPEKK